MGIAFPWNMLAKDSAPDRPKFLFSRPDMAARLGRWTEFPLTLIAAPAGYGKTTLASEARRAWKGPKCWIALDEGDADPGRFKLAPNLGTFFAHIDEVEYLSGMAAGACCRTGKLGFISARPIPKVLRHINAFARGARSMNPDAAATVVWTGTWSDPAKEAAAANTLIDGGADVLTMHVDGPITIARPPRSAARWSAATMPTPPSSRPGAGTPGRPGTGAPSWNGSSRPPGTAPGRPGISAAA